MWLEALKSIIQVLDFSLWTLRALKNLSFYVIVSVPSTGGIEHGCDCLRSFWRWSFHSLLKSIVSEVGCLLPVATKLRLSYSEGGIDGFQLAGFPRMFQYVSIVCPDLWQWSHQHFLSSSCLSLFEEFTAWDKNVELSGVATVLRFPTVTFFFLSSL